MKFCLTLDIFALNCIYVCSKMPEREDDHLTPATRLLEKRREMAEVEQALAAQKEVINHYENLPMQYTKIFFQL